MKDSEICLMLQSITDDQAENSDIGGDSDADDYLPINVHTTEKTTRSQSSSFSGNNSTSQLNSNAHSVESSNPSTSSTISMNRSLRPIRAKRALIEQFNNSSSSEIDDIDNDSVLCSSLLVPIPDMSTSSSSDDDNFENQQNENSNIFKWTKNGQIPSHFSKFKFKKKFSLNVEVDNLIILNYFALFVNTSFLNLVVTASNLYAVQSNSELNLSIPELQAVMVILIIMGFNVLPSLTLYWSENENFHNKRITDILPIKRFFQIIRFLHLNDNMKMPPKSSSKFDKLYKLRPMIKYLNTVFPEMFSPSRFMSVDESMIAFTGRTKMKQYMPLKPIKREFKVWLLACSVTGYMYAFDIYTGKSSGGEVTLGLGEKIVLLLTCALEGLDYCIFFDNFFSTIPLLVKMLEKKLFGCGTFRKNRKFYPVDFLQSDKSRKKLI